MADRPKDPQSELPHDEQGQASHHEQGQLMQEQHAHFGPFDREPSRWISSGDAPAELASLLRAARDELPTEAFISRVGGRLGVPATLSSSGISGKTWGLVGLGGIVICSLAAWQWSQVSHSEHARATPSSNLSATPSGQAPQTAPALSNAPMVADHPSLTTSKSLVRDESQASGSGRAVARPVQHADDGPAEITLIRQARSALSTNPRLTLDLLEQHRRRFSGGKLVQEREVLAVQALGRLGDKRAAEQRAASFLQNHPGSAHQSLVEQERSTGGTSVK